ncbi:MULTISPECIES: helix-turn-helix domain-containing protein [Streptomyces]|uniref:Helix-turn-helix domain-containing protein n=1 Tax=Streptomyces lichenis TaxID=2306967 RepID=A0ABT0IH56_9ACTN|nr:helix-turn-helix domain-containing protein [Streptomyces lichenis]MCK8680646.1 helix-turn-helix domain-containing protein [Streptomyces lichenis]
MRDSSPSPAASDPLEPVPREFAAIMRPELPSLLQEIKDEVTRTYPEFVPAFTGPQASYVHAAIEQSLTIFVDQVAHPSLPSPLRDEMFRTLGRTAAGDGYSLDALRGTCRIGARLALRRARKVSRHYDLSPLFMLSFADTLFQYMNQLEGLAIEGYMEGNVAIQDDQDGLRRRILRLLASGNTAYALIGELAERAGWQLPEEVSLVALSPDARPARTALAPDVLVDLTDPQPALLLPGPLDEARRESLGHALSGTLAAVGPTVALASAADSMRWARQCLALAESGIVRDGPVVYCENHLVTLWLESDPALVEQLARRELAPLDGQPATRRARLIETLRVWLATRGTAAQIGEVLHIHPQTVRYRMRNLDATFGPQLTDPDHCFATEAALRALHLRQSAAAPARRRTTPRVRR